MSKIVSFRLKDGQFERLQRVVQRLGRAPSAAAALFVEEALRESEFPLIEFRDTILGREAFLRGTRLKVWQIAWLARQFGGDAAQTAAYLEMPDDQIASALQYAEAYPDEIEVAIAENDRSPEELAQSLPNLEIFEFDASAP